jgi:hypothetical protein
MGSALAAGGASSGSLGLSIAMGVIFFVALALIWIVKSRKNR